MKALGFEENSGDLPGPGPGSVVRGSKFALRVLCLPSGPCPLCHGTHTTPSLVSRVIECSSQSFLPDVAFDSLSTFYIGIICILKKPKTENGGRVEFQSLTVRYRKFGWSGKADSGAV